MGLAFKDLACSMDIDILKGGTMNECDVEIQRLSDEEERLRTELLKRVSELEQQIEEYCCGPGCSIGGREPM